MTLKDLNNKTICILGFGREGKDTLAFLQQKFPKKKIGIADQKQGKNYLQKLKKYDVIIKSAGVPLQVITPFITKKQIVTSQTALFFAECPGTIIGVTGTKGKSTTASLIHAVLQAGKIQSTLGGNIGIPVLQFLNKATANDVFVYELSSYQLSLLKESPHIAVLLNIYPEHLDYHGGFTQYVAAKSIITKYQTPEDFVVFNQKDPLVVKIANKSKAQKLPYNPVKTKSPWLAPIEPAQIIGRLFDIPEKTIQKAITNFTPLEHRLEKVGEYKKVTFVNDSLATIPEATIGALDALGKQVHTLIAGGKDRGVNVSRLTKKINTSSVQTIILFPDTGKDIAKGLQKSKHIFFANTMQEAVQLAYTHTPKEKTCLLSPAASSYNMFQDYADRGEQFKKYIKEYAKKRT